ncbi:MAG: hypothetical protein JO060_10820 [Candidatus Eremiobacteraeota bacterium]|nr:hypothetical protein [Candidatus Eremiobacteraeota bacterium]MBV9646568.1 hypothetical protein [Candidatus Eremiobacteraeota bacterium]
MRSLGTVVLAFAALSAQVAAAAALPPTAPGILALVKATKQLEIDSSIPRGARDRWSPWVRVAHAREGTNGGYLAAAYAERGTLSDGTHVLAVPLDSGGSGGVFTQILFAAPPHAGARYVGYVSSGGHVGVRIAGGSIVVQFPDYAVNDPQCCPSHYRHQRYTIRHDRLVLVNTWRTVGRE